MMSAIEKASETVLEFLREIPMSAGTVKYYRSCYRTINIYCRSYGIDEFTDQDAVDFGKYQMDRHTSGEISFIYALTLRKAGVLLADCMKGRSLVWKRRDYKRKFLCDCYESALADFECFISSSLAPGSVKLCIQLVRQLLDYLESNNVKDFNSLTMDDLRRFVIDFAPRHKGSMVNLTWPVKKFAVFLNETGYASIDPSKLVGSSPKRIKVLPCFTAEEAETIISAVDTSTPLGKRDYAIIKIAIGTGLRGEDILGLRLSDIDWRKNEIHVAQRKTGTHILLPLLPDVGNAVADYILEARPQAESPYVFLRHRKPHTWLGDGPAGAQIMKRYQANMGIAHEPGDGKTFHAFRRTVGTNLIKAEVPLSSAAQILGHKRIESTKRYISLNDDMLRVCCMDISDYATKKERLL